MFSWSDMLRQKQELQVRLEHVEKERDQVKERLEEWIDFSKRMGTEGYPASPRSAWEQTSRYISKPQPPRHVDIVNFLL